ncbi:MAG: sigma-54 dependent transcriptional regulator, partial [Calditrichia bacterium]
MKFNCLILDDELMVCKSLQRILEDKEIHIYTATGIERARKILAEKNIDLILLDYKLNGADGLGFLREIKEEQPQLQVIMVTAYGNIDVAVEAMKSGAYDFIQKKEEPAYIRFTVKRALDNLRLQKEVEELRSACQENGGSEKIIAVSENMNRTLQLARDFAQSDSTILISGATGTGKNLLARYIHFHSSRLGKRFLSLNCAAIPRDLLESELFGYEAGAFTGASQKGKKGLLEQANGGTLFLDEISEMNQDMQSKLLHVLESRQVFRVGAVKPVEVDVRFLAATNTRLEEQVKEKRFRMDLFYRLNVAAIHIPPLRERREDIVPLAKYFISVFNRKLNKSVSHISADTKKWLQQAEWTGNVRELRNTIERAMLLKRGETLEPADFRIQARQENSAVFTVSALQNGSINGEAGVN